ncbi:MAG TPA: VOC family protein [Acidimicrobiales bacterium]|jgi:catechol-2,3-dioxygenase
MKVTELGHIVLFVRNVENSATFYANVLGWETVIPVTPGSPIAAFSSGRTHHELLLIEVGNDATVQPGGRHLGLYHFGLKIGETDEELRQAVTSLRDAGVEIVGITDHTISHSLYIRDPDGNEIELYVDVPGVDWKSDPTLIAAPAKALRL